MTLLMLRMLWRLLVLLVLGTTRLVRRRPGGASV